jgi:alkylation response protein AidB-like acyl-CoA dehydrogenase
VDELMTRESVRTWADVVLRPRVRAMDVASAIDPTIISELFAQGFMGLEIPEEHGGSGLTFTAACLAIEELARVDPSIAITADIHNTLTNNAVRFWGSPELQEQWLPRLASKSLSSFCLSEAGSGSDAFSLKTTATKSSDGSYYTLNGSKLWISNAREADVLLVFANADPSAGYKGITAFLLDVNDYESGNGNGSISIGPPESKLGLRSSSTCPIHFDNTKVPSSNMIGSIGMGYRYCIEILNEGRIGIAAQQLGIAKGCLYDIALPYMMEREQFGSPIANFQGMEHQYAQIATEIHAAETMTYNACRLKEMHQRHPQDGHSFVREASMAKLYSSQVAEKTASKTIEWLGGIGFTTDLLAEKMYRDCKVGSIYEGTSNIQLQTIAKLMRSECETNQR